MHTHTFFYADFLLTFLFPSLVVPFLRFGEVLSGGPHFPLTSDALKKVLTGQASHEVLSSIAHAVGCPYETFKFDSLAFYMRVFSSQLCKFISLNYLFLLNHLPCPPPDLLIDKQFPN